MSDNFLYSSDNAVMLLELQCYLVTVRQHSGVSSESESGLSVGTSMALVPECSLIFLQKCTCVYENPYLTAAYIISAMFCNLFKMQEHKIPSFLRIWSI